MINYNNKSFSPISTSKNSEVSSETIFTYKQKGNVITSDYSGGKIEKGHLIGIVDALGNITMSYHQISIEGHLMTGTCHSKPEILPNGKIKLHENWQWTSGDMSKGSSILIEI